jgi:hypothetical protein
MVTPVYPPSTPRKSIQYETAATKYCIAYVQRRTPLCSNMTKKNTNGIHLYLFLISKVENRLNHTFLEESEENEPKKAAAGKRRMSMAAAVVPTADWVEEVISLIDVDIKTRAAFGFSEYLTGTVSWLLGVEQILYNVGHVTDADGKDKDIYRYYGVTGKEGQMTSHRWVFDGKGACLDRIGDKVLGAGICHWLSLALDGGGVDSSKQVVFHPRAPT